MTENGLIKFETVDTKPRTQQIEYLYKYILFNIEFIIKEHFQIFGEMVQKPWEIRKCHLFFVEHVCMLIEY